MIKYDELFATLIAVVFYFYATPCMISVTLYQIHLLTTCPFLESIDESMYCLQEPSRLLVKFFLDTCVLPPPPVPDQATLHPTLAAILDPYWH